MKSKNASKLIIAPAQDCVLGYEGKVMNLIEEEGICDLKTDNQPLITSLISIRKNFVSELKLFVYFHCKAKVLNQGWEISSRIKCVDAMYNIPVQMGVHGNFSYHINDITFLFNHIVGSKVDYRGAPAARGKLLTALRCPMLSDF